MLAGDEPVDCRVHERENVCCRIEHCKIELFSQTAHISRERHSPDKPVLEATPIFFRIGMIQVGEGPRLG